MPLFNNYDNCTVLFPSRRRDIITTKPQPPLVTPLRAPASSKIAPNPPLGLLVELTRLNVPCIYGGYISIGDSSLLCGKLEDLSQNDRRFYFPSHINTSVQLHRNPLFRLNYKLVDYCYNVTLTDRNGSYFVQPNAATASLECFFRIHLPYGYRIELNLVTNRKREAGDDDEDDDDSIQKSDINLNDNRYNDAINNDDEINYDNVRQKTNNRFDGKIRQQQMVETEFIEFQQPWSDNFESSFTHCTDGLAVSLEDSNLANGGSAGKWSHCISAYSAPRKFNVISSGNTMMLRVKRLVSKHPLMNGKLSDKGIVSLDLNYVALPVPQLVSQCAFGWVAMQQLCLTAVDEALPWADAEAECVKRGGHLASIQSERDQRVIDQLLLNR